MGGIGSVFTLEEYRHKGVAMALMRLSVDTMIREGFEVSLLLVRRWTCLWFRELFSFSSETHLLTLW